MEITKRERESIESLFELSEWLAKTGNTILANSEGKVILSVHNNNGFTDFEFSEEITHEDIIKGRYVSSDGMTGAFINELLKR